MAEIWVRRWKIILVNTIFIILIGLYLVLGLKNFYHSTITIIPELGSSRNSMGGLTDLAALAGINVGAGGDQQPTEVYEYLISTETILLPVAYKKYPNPKENIKDRDSLNLFEFFEISIDDSQKYSKSDLVRLKQIEVVREMNKKIQTVFDKKTKILDVTVETENALLSSLIANEVIKSLDDYVVNRQKSKAKYNREYLQRRTSQVKDSLNRIEDLLVNFRERNRIVFAPNLSLEQARLMRSLEIQQGIYVELTKQLELAKMQEIKDTPIVSIREFAKNPILKAGPSRVQLLSIALLVQLFGTFFLFVVKRFYVTHFQSTK